MYYVMSVPEILVLMFVLFLWVLSIVWFFKRYEKISTIERADLGHHNINLDTKQDLTMDNQNSSLEEIGIGNDENNNEEDEGSTSLLRGEEDDEDELDENSSIINFKTKTESLKDLTTTASATNSNTINTSKTISSSPEYLKAFNLNNNNNTNTNSNLLNLTNNNLSVYGGASSACTSATTSINNFKDSIYNMFNSFNSGTNLLKNTYLDVEDHGVNGTTTTTTVVTTTNILHEKNAQSIVYLKNKSTRSNSMQQKPMQNAFRTTKLKQRGYSNKVR